MKAFNLIISTYAFALVAVLGLCAGAEYLFGEDAKYFVIVPALLLGFSARRIVEKFYGYTLLEALKNGDKNDL